MSFAFGKKRSLAALALSAALAFSGLSAAEGRDITASVIEAGKNRSNLVFASDDDSALARYLDKENLAWVDTLLDAPVGATNYSSQANQISSRSGFSFNIPTGAASLVPGAVVRVEGSFALTKNNIGSGTYETFVSDMRALPGEINTESGKAYFTPQDRDFIERYGLEIRALFTNGDRKEITRYCDYKIALDDADSGFVTVVFGATYVDADQNDGSLWSEVTLDDGARRTFFYDGKRDGSINGSFWLVKGPSTVSDDGTGGGCRTGASVPLLLAAAAGSYRARRWRRV